MLFCYYKHHTVNMNIENVVRCRIIDMHKILRKTRGRLEKNFLKYKDFTIISNNCWGDGYIDIIICLIFLLLSGIS